jgi:PAS domain S-box-containing protein
MVKMFSYSNNCPDDTVRKIQESNTIFINRLDEGFELLELVYNKEEKIEDFVFLEVNAAYERQSGLKASNIIGKRKKEVAPAAEQRWYDYAIQAVEKGETLSYQYYNPKVNRLFETQFIPIPPNQIAVLFKDITERKNAEEALKESENLYHMLFENSEDGFQVAQIIYDKQGNPVNLQYLEVNDAFTKQTGIKQNMVEGKTAKELFPCLESYWLEIFNKVLHTCKPTHFENFNKDTQRWYDAYLFPYKKNIVGGLFRDITERKKIEQSLKESEGWFKSLVESTSDWIWQVDENVKYTYASPKINDILGYEPQEILGKMPFDLMPKNEALKISKVFEKITSNKIPFRNLENWNIHKNGKLVLLETSGIPIIDDRGSLKGYRGIDRDVTKRREIMEALRLSEEKFSKAFLNSPFAVTLTCLDDGKIVEINDSAASLFGYERHEVVGRTTLEFQMWVNPEDRQKFIHDLNSSGIIRNRELSLRKRNGTIFYILISASVIIIQGEKHFLSTFLDITERKKSENELRQAQAKLQEYANNLEQLVKERTKKLQEAERLATIGATAGMVGHDIRNPLQAIMSDTYLLKDELTTMPCDKTKEGVIESIDSIERNIAYINKIVQDLQDYARPVVPEYSDVDLSDVFVHIFETIGVPETIKLSIKVRNAEKIRIDPTLLQRAVTNLVDNAIQAMPEGGKLEILGEKIDNKIVVIVSDTGVGIPDEVKPKLFTPMMTTKAKGQGFGLAVSKRLIEAMKGTISFESEEGKGTKFTLELPMF